MKIAFTIILALLFAQQPEPVSGSDGTMSVVLSSMD
jgi:hypothetical protein